MQKEFDFYGEPQSKLWDGMWTSRTIEEELEACDLETPVRQAFLSFIPREGKIIDAGCGFGKWVIYLKRRGYNIIGIDNNEMAINKLINYDGTLQVQLGDIMDINYPDDFFDAYISMGVIEHFEGGPSPALKEAHRVLKPNGLIFISVPTVNILRRIVRRSIRNAVNSLPMSLMILQSGWRKSRRAAVVGAIWKLLPERMKAFLIGKENRFYHFTEYRYSKTELQAFLRQSGFEVIKTVPHDFYGSRNHAVGLVVDFPFLGARNGVNFRLNLVGKLISVTLNSISPWIACSSILCVGRSLKGDLGSRVK